VGETHAAPAAPAVTHKHYPPLPRAAGLPVCFSVCVWFAFYTRSRFIRSNSPHLFCVSSVPARLPALPVGSYQPATTAGNSIHAFFALEQPIWPGAVITLGQAAASDHDRRTVGLPWLRTASKLGNALSPPIQYPKQNPSQFNCFPIRILTCANKGARMPAIPFVAVQLAPVHALVRDI
jgi:hypothetical protein